MKYSVGDKVVIIGHALGKCGIEGCPSFTREMNARIGNIVEIRSINDGFYHISGDACYWTDCMLASGEASYNFSAGNILISRKGKKRKVLGYDSGNYFLSKIGKFDQLGVMYTKKILSKHQYTLWRK